MKDFAVIIICLIAGCFIALKYLELFPGNEPRDSIPDDWKEEIKGLYDPEPELPEILEPEPELPDMYYYLLNFADALEDKANEVVKQIDGTYYKYPADKRQRFLIQAEQNRQKAEKIYQKTYTRQ